MEIWSRLEHTCSGVLDDIITGFEKQHHIISDDKYTHLTRAGVSISICICIVYKVCVAVKVNLKWDWLPVTLSYFQRCIQNKRCIYATVHLLKKKTIITY